MYAVSFGPPTTAATFASSRRQSQQHHRFPSEYRERHKVGSFSPEHLSGKESKSTSDDVINTSGGSRRVITITPHACAMEASKAARKSRREKNKKALLPPQNTGPLSPSWESGRQVSGAPTYHHTKNKLTLWRIHETQSHEPAGTLAPPPFNHQDKVRF